MIRFEYSADENLLFMALGEGPAVETVEIDESVYIDLDAAGRPIGIEFLDAGGFLAFLNRNGGRLSLSGLVEEHASIAPAS